MEFKAVRPLTAVQYDLAVKAAESRTLKQIGARPQRHNFWLEFGPLLNPLDFPLLILFIAAFAVSATHIIRAMGFLVAQSIHQDYIGGIQINTSFEIALSQIASLAMNESALIVFMVMFNFRMHQRRTAQNRSIDQTILDYMPLVGAFIAIVFIFWANIQSGLGLLAIIAPVFTAIGSIRLEEIASEKIKRNDTVTSRYTVALETYEHAVSNIRHHENFKKNLYESIFERCCQWNKKTIPDMADAEFEFKLTVVQSEIERHERWMEADVKPVRKKPEPKVKKASVRQNGSMNTVYEFLLAHPELNPRLNNEFTYAKVAESVSGHLGYNVSQSTIHKIAARIAQNGASK